MVYTLRVVVDSGNADRRIKVGDIITAWRKDTKGALRNLWCHYIYFYFTRWPSLCRWYRRLPWKDENRLSVAWLLVRCWNRNERYRTSGSYTLRSILLCKWHVIYVNFNETICYSAMMNNREPPCPRCDRPSHCTQTYNVSSKYYGIIIRGRLRPSAMCRMLPFWR